jgi:hypothetical protein
LVAIGHGQAIVAATGTRHVAGTPGFDATDVPHQLKKVLAPTIDVRFFAVFVIVPTRHAFVIVVAGIRFAIAVVVAVPGIGARCAFTTAIHVTLSCFVVAFFVAAQFIGGQSTALVLFHVTFRGQTIHVSFASFAIFAFWAIVTSTIHPRFTPVFDPVLAGHTYPKTNFVGGQQWNAKWVVMVGARIDFAYVNVVAGVDGTLTGAFLKTAGPRFAVVRATQGGVLEHGVFIVVHPTCPVHSAPSAGASWCLVKVSEHFSGTCFFTTPPSIPLTDTDGRVTEASAVGGRFTDPTAVVIALATSLHIVPPPKFVHVPVFSPKTIFHGGQTIAFDVVPSFFVVATARSTIAAQFALFAVPASRRYFSAMVPPAIRARFVPVAHSIAATAALQIGGFHLHHVATHVRSLARRWHQPIFAIRTGALVSKTLRHRVAKGGHRVNVVGRAGIHGAVGVLHFLFGGVAAHVIGPVRMHRHVNVFAVTVVAGGRRIGFVFTGVKTGTVKFGVKFEMTAFQFVQPQLTRRRSAATVVDGVTHGGFTIGIHTALLSGVASRTRRTKLSRDTGQRLGMVFKHTRSHFHQVRVFGVRVGGHVLHVFHATTVNITFSPVHDTVRT